MKTRLFVGILLIFLVGSCHKNTDIGPADLLYRRWHPEREKDIGDDLWKAYNTDGYYDTEYRTDGMLVYRKDRVIIPLRCCVPGRFERNGNVIQYTEFPDCPFTLCAPPQQAIITVLRKNLLELQIGNTITQYTPVD